MNSLNIIFMFLFSLLLEIYMKGEDKEHMIFNFYVERINVNR